MAARSSASHAVLALVRAGAAVLTVALLGASPAAAFDRTNIPLKNWGGFSIYRDAVYDDLERLVTAGLADRTLLSTKPLSRVEAARIVARAIETIRKDDSGPASARRDLEDLLDRLIEEFRPELTALGTKLPVAAAPTGTVSFTPVDRAQAFGIFSHRPLRLINEQGLRLEEFNGGVTFESRLQVGDVLTFYLQPQLHGNEEYGAARLATGYAKLTLFNVELLVGRDSLWWGPGLHGSLIFSNNAPPLDQVRIGSAEPFLLPWIGDWIGPTKILFFIAQLEARREHPRAKLAGMRGTITPFPFLELGISRAVQFDGDDKPSPNVSDYPEILFNPPAGDDPSQPQFRSNNVFAIDADLRLANVDRFYLPAKDLRLYGEFGWDDTCCSSAFVPLKDALSMLVGLQLFSVFGQEGVDLRAEYAQSSRLSFTHHQFTNGFWTRGYVISHQMGTDGQDFFARVTNRFRPDMMLGLQVNWASIGNTASNFPGPKEKRIGGAIDVSYRFWDRYSLFAQYEIADVTNRNFEAGEDGLDHLLRVELTRTFR
jgi:hypothetical protein